MCQTAQMGSRAAAMVVQSTPKGPANATQVGSKHGTHSWRFAIELLHSKQPILTRELPYLPRLAAALKTCFISAMAQVK